MKKYLGWGLLSVGLILAGCESLKLGRKPPEAQMEFEGGELIILEKLALDQVWRATEAALGSLNGAEIFPIKKEKDGLGALVEARGAGDKRIRISLRGAEAKATEIRIRVGRTGDEEYARRLYGTIRANY